MILEKDLTQHSIEKLLCEKIHSVKQIPLVKEEMELLMMLIQAEKLEIPEKDKPFLFKVIEKRIEHCFDFKTKHNVILLLCDWFKSPGKAIMILWYIQWHCKKKNIKELTMDEVCRNIFYNGIPAEQELSTIWNDTKVVCQKGSGANLVDIQEAGKSLRF